MSKDSFSIRNNHKLQIPNFFQCITLKKIIFKIKNNVIDVLKSCELEQ